LFLSSSLPLPVYTYKSKKEMPVISRIIKIAGLLFIGGALCAAIAPGAETDPLAGAKLFRDVESYAGFGVHRTATAADLKTSEWLRARLEAAGLRAEFFPWTLDQFFLEHSSLTIDGKAVESFPLWQPQATERQGVRDALVRFSPDLSGETLRGRIVVFAAEFTAQGKWQRAWLNRAAEAGAVGAVLVITSRHGAVTAINATAANAERPLPLPALIVSSRDEERLRAATSHGAVATLRITGAYKRGVQARNVVGKLQRGPKWIVVSTPTSGWFQCAAERGGGVAVWLALAEWANRRKTQTSFLFLGNSGHELAYLGAHKFHASGQTPKPADTLVWLHLGAGVGARAWEQAGAGWQPLRKLRPGAADAAPEFLPLVRQAFAAVPAYTPREARGIGETSEVMKAGYKVFNLVAGNHWIHTRFDRADSTGPEALEPVARAAAQVLEAIEAETIKP
jgi:hypothetical protein